VPNCGERKLADPRQFNLMFKTFVGPVETPRRSRGSGGDAQ